MLCELTIQDLAIIDSLSIRFSPGFNVITGETGAGKSILIKALGLLLGGKVPADTVRSGSSQAVVCATFELPLQHPAFEAMGQLGMASDPSEGTLIIRRVISNKGRTQTWINDIPVTIASLKAVTLHLMDILGQHENHRLLDPSTHYRYLDQFLPKPAALGRYISALAAAKSDLKDLRTLLRDYGSSQNSQDFLEFQLKQLTDLDPNVDDYEQCVVACKRQESEERLKHAAESLDSLTNSDHQGPGALLGFMAKLLESVASEVPKVRSISERLKEVSQEVEDLIFEANQCLQSDLDTLDNLEHSQERLARYQSLFRKFSVRDVQGLMVVKGDLQSKLDQLNAIESLTYERLRILKVKLSKADEFGDKLSATRKKASEILRKKVLTELRDLAMVGVDLKVRFQPIQQSVAELNFPFESSDCEEAWTEISEFLTQMSDVGKETIDFMMASNPGEPMRPMHKVISGGEASRILLSLKKAISRTTETCVLVFDEIDTGISGRIASKVGGKLRSLGKDFQILCISHLPQVASHADQHLLASKSKVGGRTLSKISSLDSSESAIEIAKLLSGGSVEKTSIAHAKQLIRNARGLG